MHLHKHLTLCRSNIVCCSVDRLLKLGVCFLTFEVFCMQVCINYLQSLNGHQMVVSYRLTPNAQHISHSSLYCKTLSFLHMLRCIIVSVFVSGICALVEIIQQSRLLKLDMNHIYLYIEYIYRYICVYVYKHCWPLIPLASAAAHSCIIFWPPFPANTCADSAALYISNYRPQA